MSGAICGGYRYEYKRQRVRRKLWCFKDRKHLRHEWVLLGDVPFGEPSWYEPIWIRQCTSCGEDHTRFGEEIW